MGIVWTIVAKLISSLIGQWIEARRKAALEAKAAEADRLARYIESLKEANKVESAIKEQLKLDEITERTATLKEKLSKIRSFNKKYGKKK